MSDSKELDLLVEKKVAELLQNNPDKVIEIYMRKNEILKNQLDEMMPKAEFYDTVTRSDTEFLMREVAKVLNFKDMGQNKLYVFLRRNNVLNKNNEPYQHPHVEAGRFSYKQNTWRNPRTGETIVTKTPVVTQKGIDYIRKLLIGEGYEFNER